MAAVSRTFLLLVTLLFGRLAGAATVGQWAQNNGIWAVSGNFSSIYAAATGQLHAVGGPVPISASNLAAYQFFLIENPSGSPLDPAALSALSNWVVGGGILLLFSDVSNGGNTSATIVNQVLNGLGMGASGSAMSVHPDQPIGAGSGITTLGILAGIDPAVTGLTGGTLDLFQSSTINGGSALATGALSNALRVDGFGAGKVYTFGDRFDANSFLAHNSNNGAFFENLLAQEVPEPATFLLAGFALTGLLMRSRFRLDPDRHLILPISSLPASHRRRDVHHSGWDKQ